MKNDQKSYCKDCGKSVGTKAHALQCDRCDEWLHAKCAGIPSDLYLMLKKYSVTRLKLFCRKCDQCDEDEPRKLTCSDTDDADTDTDVTCIPATHTSTPKLQRTYANVIKGPAFKNTDHDSNQKPSTICDYANIQELAAKVDNLQKLLETVTPESNHAHAFKCTAQLPSKDIKVPPGRNRKQCLILMNVPESDADKSQDRLNHDVAQVHTCLSQLFSPDEADLAKQIRLLSVYRLGKRTPGKHRPLKIVCGSEDQIKTITKRSYRLKGQDIRILRDLSPEDRLRLRTAVKELQEKRANGDNDWIIRDFQLVRRRPKVKWHPLQPQCVFPGKQSERPILAPVLENNLADSLGTPTSAV